MLTPPLAGPSGKVKLAPKNHVAEASKEVRAYLTCAVPRFSPANPERYPCGQEARLYLQEADWC